VSPSTVPDQEGYDTDNQPAVGGVFSERTGTFLLFDDGIDGVLGVDLDNRVAARRVLEGQRAGDAMNRMVRVDDTLVVGWASIHALSLDTLEPRGLGKATVFIPAAEGGRVWLIDYPGGRIGQGTPTYQQVSVDGNKISMSQGLDPSQALPALGIPGGIVHETDAGIDIWDVDSEEVTRIVGAGVGFVADVHESLIAWCDGECVLHLTEIGELDIVVSPPDQSRNFDPRSARFSPDGRLLAAIVSDPGGSQAAIAIVEVESGAATLITEPLMPGPSYVAWSDDGDSLFFSSWSYQETRHCWAGTGHTTDISRSPPFHSVERSPSSCSKSMMPGHSSRTNSTLRTSALRSQPIQAGVPESAGSTSESKTNPDVSRDCRVVADPKPIGLESPKVQA
jgi:sugar lactone lactonase YvrE